MASLGGSRMGSVVIGALAMLLVLIAIGVAVVFGGFYPIAASNPDSAGIGFVLHETMEKSVKRSAGGLHAPKLTSADILEGGSHFKGMCQQCHGGPGAEREDFATTMNPQPPDLSREQSEWSVEEIFWIARNGIKMSGMPAFGKVDEDEELWKIAAFVKQLPKVSSSQYQALPNAHEHGEGSEAEAGHHH